MYSDDISFLALFRRLWLRLLTDRDHFRRFSELARDVVQAESGELPLPNVIFVEPSYLDSPIHPDHEPNDNHPPLQIGFGEDFLRQVYQAVTPRDHLGLWRNMLMVVTYDEHGGFYDHVSPLFPVHADGGQGNPPFESTGPRVPAFVISPFASEGHIYSKNLDHTCILEFLAQRFTPGGEYSTALTQRLAQAGFTTGAGRGNLLETLDRLDNPRSDPPEEPATIVGGSRLLAGKKVAHTANELAFEEALKGMVEQHPAETAANYPELVHWYHNR